MDLFVSGVLSDINLTFGLEGIVTMTGEHADEIKKHVRTNIAVFVALLVLTLVTVTVSGLKVGVGVSIVFALIIASVKSSLVGAFFMHLTVEKRAVYGVLLLVGVFFVSMLGLLVWSLHSPLTGTSPAPMGARVEVSATSEGQ